jgi:hypothetical protein
MTYRQFVVWLLVGVLLGALLAVATVARPAHAVEPRSSVVRHHGPCSGTMAVIRHDIRRSLVAKRVDKLVRCAFSRFSGDVARGLCTEDRESGGDFPWAGKGTNYLGLFQHARTYWPGRARKYLRDSWFPRMARDRGWYPSALNARANALVSSRMVKAGGWSPWSGGCI